MKKITVIIGGSSGLGLAAARCLAPESALLICSRSAEKLARAKEELEDFGGEVYTYQMDAAIREDVKNCAAYAAGLGEIQNVVVSAGVSPGNSYTEEIIRINALSPIYTVEEFLPVLPEGAAMVLFGSTAGYTFDTTEQLASLRPVLKGIFENWRQDLCGSIQDFLANTMRLPKERQAGIAYCVTKNFVRYFVYANVSRFARKGCRIVSVSPGSYYTPMHKALIENHPDSADRAMASTVLKRWGRPYELGTLVKYLCSHEAGFITGVDLLADGGCTYASTVTQIS